MFQELFQVPPYSITLTSKIPKKLHLQLSKFNAEKNKQLITFCISSSGRAKIKIRFA